MFPLTYAEIGKDFTVKRIGGSEEVRRHLENLGFTVLPSCANFVFARSPQLSGETLYRKLKENGVLVRWFDTPRLRDWLRVTIGSPEEMNEFIDRTERILEEAGESA